MVPQPTHLRLLRRALRAPGCVTRSGGRSPKMGGSDTAASPSRGRPFCGLAHTGRLDYKDLADLCQAVTLRTLDGRAFGTVDVTGATSIAELKQAATAALATAAAAKEADGEVDGEADDEVDGEVSEEVDEMVDGMSEAEAKLKLKEMLRDAGGRKRGRSGAADTPPPPPTAPGAV